MKEKIFNGQILGRFKSIQSAIFAAVSILVLSAVLIVTLVSLRYTRSSIFENSVMYTQTIIRQMNQNIDSYIEYMDNIALMVAGSEDVQRYLFEDRDGEEYKKRVQEQFGTILKGREDIRNLGVLRLGGPALINDGNKRVNQYLDLEGQEWYRNAIESYGKSAVSSSHVQHVVQGERPWVITLSRGILDFTGSGSNEGVFFIDLNYSAISELCDQNSMGEKGYVFILDADGNIVYHPQQQQLYNELQTENIDMILNADSDTVLAGEGNNGKIYTLSQSEKTGWTVVGCMNSGELLRRSRQAQVIYILTAIVLVVIALIFSDFIAATITYPIQKLRDSMERYRKVILTRQMWRFFPEMRSAV